MWLLTNDNGHVDSFQFKSWLGVKMVMKQKMSTQATGGGVNASQTTSLNKKCQDLILKSSELPTIRDGVLVPILDYCMNDSSQRLSLKNDSIKIMWHLFRQGALMCELLNQVQPGVIQVVTLPIPPIGPTNFSDTNSRQNVAAFIKASRDMFFLTDDQLFSPGDMYKEDFNAFSKALGLCEMYLNNKLRVSSRNSVAITNQSLTPEIMSLFDISKDAEPLKEREDADEKRMSDPVRMSKRERILEEMIASERVYVDDLARLNKFKEIMKFERLLSQKSLDAIFSNLKDLLNFQRKFMIEMESVVQSSTPDFGNLFISHEANFSLYEIFCLNHALALSTLRENRAVIDSHPQLMESIGGGIDGYLIKPIQRVTRYSLFLRDLHKDALKRGDEAEAKSVEIAAESVKRVTNRINERQRAAENELASIEFFEHFHPKIMSPDKTGKLVLHDSAVRLRLDGELKVYQVYLFQRKLIMCAEKEMIGPFWLKNRISIPSIKQVQDCQSGEPEVPYEAKVVCSISDKEVSFSLMFRTRQAQRMWIDSLRSLAELPAMEYPADEVAEKVESVADAVKVAVPVTVTDEVPQVKERRIRVQFRNEYYSFVLSESKSTTIGEFCELVHSEILRAHQLDFESIHDLPDVGRIRLRFKSPEGVVERLSNDQVLRWLLRESTTAEPLDFLVHEGYALRVRFTYRDCMYSFKVDQITALEELKIYIYETIAEDYRMINANLDAIPKGDAMRIFFKEPDSQWSLMLYDNDLEVALELSDRNIELKL